MLASLAEQIGFEYPEDRFSRYYMITLRDYMISRDEAHLMLSRGCSPSEILLFETTDDGQF